MQLFEEPPVLEEVEPVRHYSRLVVRQLGMLGGNLQQFGLTNSQCHTLIELGNDAPLTAGELADRLNLDRSTMSRIVASLIESGDVQEGRTASDARQKPLTLTDKGKDKLSRVNAAVSDQVDHALKQLSNEERQVVVAGMALYSKALARSNFLRQFAIRPIRPEDNDAVARIIRSVMTEYGANQPGSAYYDDEVTSMYENYSAPRSAFWVVERDGKIVGGGGIAPLQGGDGHTCELRKMYFLPEVRGRGLGKVLLARCLEFAREAGFKTCYLETIQSMLQARALYESFGFERVCAPQGGTGHYFCDTWYQKAL